MIRCSLLRFGLVASLCATTALAGAQMRGIWMHATQIKTRAEADQWVARIDQARLNAVFILVWYWGGQAFFRSELCPMGDGVEEGYDPLGHMVPACHARGIEVHAWFVNGAYGAAKPKHVLDEHPEWAVETGGGTLWYDFGKPAVRQFQSDLMVECLRKYDVDGIHFDYIRYGPRHCLCKHCQGEFARRYGYEPLTGPRGAAFPVAALVSANPVVEPTTATVLAQFGDGTPAIATNALGRGHVLLLNWHAEKDAPRPAEETLKRALAAWKAPRDRVFALDTEPNRQRYGRRFTEAAVAWFRRLGYKAQAITEDKLPAVPKDALLVLSCLYYIPGAVATAIEQFVRDGGTLVVIDGPVHAIRNAAVQRVLGFKASGRYFRRFEVIQATADAEKTPGVFSLPTSDHAIDLEKEKLREEKWKEFRKWGVTELVRDVYRRAKALKPQARVTAAVFTPLASADKACQDWPRWLREGCIDFVIPMAYTASNDALATQLQEWKTVDPTLERIVPGLSIYTRGRDGKATTRDIDLILSQHRLVAERGAHGNLYFSLHYLSPELIEAFRTKLYPTKVQVYRPAPRPSAP